jgi:hypothetical protein
MRTGCLRLASKMNRVGSVIGAHTSHNIGSPLCRIDNGAQQLGFFSIRSGGRLASRPADDEAVISMFYQVGGKTRSRGQVEGAIIGKALYAGAFTLPEALAVAAG